MAEIVPVLEGSGKGLSILEVGGGFPPQIGKFLSGREITVVDVHPGDAPGYVMAGGCELPFQDDRFDIAVSLDTLEHVVPERRELFIHELCRVAKSYVILAAPFYSEAVRSADKAIFEFIRGQSGYDHPYLKEHLELALPDLVSTIVGLVDRGLDVQVIPSGRLDRWMLMMASYYSLDSDPEMADAIPFFMEAYNRAFYDYDKAEPSYRHFLVGAAEGLGPRWGELADLASGEAAERADFRGLSLVIEMARAMALKKKRKEKEELLEKLAARDEEIASLKEEIELLADFMDKTKALPLYSFYEKLIKPRLK